jgi:hypothetical protein
MHGLVWAICNDWPTGFGRSVQRVVSGRFRRAKRQGIVLGLSGFLVRLLAVTFLVAASYNPSGYSFWHWIWQADATPWEPKALAAVLIVAGLIYCGHATLRSLSWVGIILLLLLIASVIWLAAERDWIDLSDSLTRWLTAELSLIFMLSMGTSFSHIRYRLSGQLDSRSLT